MIKVKLNFLIIAVLINILFIATINAQEPNLDNANVKPGRRINNEDTAKVSSKSPTGAMIRSLIFPGWGQLYNKKYFKAILAFGAEIGLLTNSIYLNQKYKASDTELEREFYINNRNLSNWWLVGVILFSMADAFVDAHLSDFDESANLTSLKISPISSGNTLGFQLSVCFNFQCQ
jgi:hypothetical protein